MIMADILKILLIIVGILIVYVSYWLLAEGLFPRLVEVFGSNRLAWGSNFPASEGKLGALLDVAKKSLACLPAGDQDWIFAGTARRLYPALA